MLQPDGTETEKEGLIGVDHVAYTYSSLDDLLENYEQLKAQGIMPYWCVHHGVTVSMYYADPEDWLAQKKGGAALTDFLVRQVHEPMSPLRGALGQ